jgi:2-hydroxy-6-oxonona-2,4-dienedioate hydrolase
MKLLLFVVLAVSAWIGWRFHTDLQAATARAMQRGTVIATRCGPIEYEEAGQGTPLLMIHGSGGGHDQGMAFARDFTAQGLRVIAPSRFGYLRTPLPADATPPAQADAHACLLDALGIERAAVLGASAGALSAMQLAIRHPGRVSALILVVPITYKPAAAAAPTAPTAPTPNAWAERVLMALISSDFAYWSAVHIARDQVLQRVLATPPALIASASPAERARLDAMVRDILPISARADGLRNETRVTTAPPPYDLAAIRSPTLLISARDDGYGTYANAEYTASRIANARFIGFEHGGHLLLGHDDEMQRAVVAHVRANARP